MTTPYLYKDFSVLTQHKHETLFYFYCTALLIFTTSITSNQLFYVVYINIVIYVQP